jgi:hypothetical protein
VDEPVSAVDAARRSLARSSSVAAAALGTVLSEDDDEALELLNDEELDALSSRLNETFLTNLVRYAVREDMEDEMNALDSCGFNLLHYVCLYNHRRLVCVLVEQGVSISFLLFYHPLAPPSLAGRERSSLGVIVKVRFSRSLARPPSRHRPRSRPRHTLTQAERTSTARAETGERRS